MPWVCTVNKKKRVCDEMCSHFATGPFAYADHHMKKGDVTKFIPTKRALPRIIWSGAEPFVL